jgi:hypothetical protein
LTKTKIETSYDAKYVPIILWWDDVTDIFEILTVGTKSVELSTKQYKFSTLEAAKEHFGDIPQYDLTISASSPYATVTAERLHVSSGPSSAQIFLEIDQILKKRQRWPKWFYSNWLIIPVMSMGMLYFTVLDDLTKGILTTLQAILTAIFARSAYISVKRGLVVYPKKKSEAKGFFQRNRDQLLMHLITLTLGAALGFAGNQLKEKFYPATMTAPHK